MFKGTVALKIVLLYWVSARLLFPASWYLTTCVMCFKSTINTIGHLKCFQIISSICLVDSCQQLSVITGRAPHRMSPTTGSHSKSIWEVATVIVISRVYQARCRAAWKEAGRKRSAGHHAQCRCSEWDSVKCYTEWTEHIKHVFVSFSLCATLTKGMEVKDWRNEIRGCCR